MIREEVAKHLSSGIVEQQAVAIHFFCLSSNG